MLARAELDNTRTRAFGYVEPLYVCAIVDKRVRPSRSQVKQRDAEHRRLGLPGCVWKVRLRRQHWGGTVCGKVGLRPDRMRTPVEIAATEPLADRCLNAKAMTAKVSGTRKDERPFREDGGSY